MPAGVHPTSVTANSLNAPCIFTAPEMGIKMLKQGKRRSGDIVYGAALGNIVQSLNVLQETAHFLPSEKTG